MMSQGIVSNKLNICPLGKKKKKKKKKIKKKLKNNNSSISRESVYSNFSKN